MEKSLPTKWIAPRKTILQTKRLLGIWCVRSQTNTQKFQGVLDVEELANQRAASLSLQFNLESDIGTRI